MPKNPDVSKSMAKHEQRRQLKKAKKQVKRNRDVRPPRRQNWLDYEDADGFTRVERVMPRGEHERRRQVAVMLETPAEEIPEPVAGTRGVVMEVSTGLVRVSVNGSTFLCTVRGSLTARETGYTNVVAVGDDVVITGDDGNQQGVVEQVLPRRNEIARPDPFYSHLRLVLAANVDQLLIVASWRDPHFWPELVDRYVIAAELSGVKPVLCVNKIDLATSMQEVEEAVEPYRALGVQVILTSAATGVGTDELRQALSGSVSVLAGLSGVGKSSLLTAVQPGFRLRVGEVNTDSHQGRHTTTQSTMLPFADGYVIDTPGIRDFGLFGVHQRELIEHYPDLLTHAGECRFSNCTHRSEPDCAVRGAASRGELSPVRLDSYQKIHDSLPA